jgi:hypothetical protein
MAGVRIMAITRRAPGRGSEEVKSLGVDERRTRACWQEHVDDGNFLERLRKRSWPRREGNKENAR